MKRETDLIPLKELKPNLLLILRGIDASNFTLSFAFSPSEQKRRTAMSRLVVLSTRLGSGEWWARSTDRATSIRLVRLRTGILEESTQIGKKEERNASLK